MEEGPHGMPIKRFGIKGLLEEFNLSGTCGDYPIQNDSATKSGRQVNEAAAHGRR